VRFVSLFADIGGLDLGLERAGMTCVAQVENDPWCNLILEKHWPDVPRFGDITKLDPKELPDADLICGGFPCQPVSLAGNRLAQDDPQWLWPHYFRIVRHLRPRFVLVENVPGLASAGMGDVLGDLAAVGYDTEWQSVSACAFGASHSRPRLFFVAYSASARLEGQNGQVRPEVYSRQTHRDVRTQREAFRAGPQPSGMAHGIPRRVDRLRGLGNAVVPQVAEHVGRLIMVSV